MGTLGGAAGRWGALLGPPVTLQPCLFSSPVSSHGLCLQMGRSSCLILKCVVFLGNPPYPFVRDLGRRSAWFLGCTRIPEVNHKFPSVEEMGNVK